MFSRFYLVLGIISMLGFALGQYRGTSPFDSFASSANAIRSSGSHTYHK